MSQSPKQDDKKAPEFNEFHAHFSSDFVMNDHSVGSLNSTDIKNQSFDEFELDTKYRCVSAAQTSNLFGFDLSSRNPPEFSENSFLQTQNNAINVAKTLNKATPQIEVANKVTSQAPSAKPNRPITVPVEPFYIAPATHFLTTLNAGDIKARVETVLRGISGVSYEFYADKCRWEGVYLVSSVRCKFEFNVYRRQSGGFVVEGNRLNGDSMAFITVYKAVRSRFVTSPDDQEPIPMLPIPDSLNDVSVSDMDEGIDGVLSMAYSGKGEAQLGASQIFCDIFNRADSTHLISKYAECLTALVDLVNVDFQSCNQHAICALAHLSSSHECQEMLIKDTSFLQTLLPLCSADGNFNSMEMRRECARLLANISSCKGTEGAQEVVSHAGLQHVQSFLQSVDNLKDDKLRVHAERARDSLSKVTSICA
mmetsp:Transcript_6201/g.10136  ORF Transcript_6201/g.10136 Transcript_6201/m.10136 type:complete len:423 (-) Transcript_6201:242-1510(-)